MKPDRATKNWQKKIMADAEKTLGRKLTETENRFTPSKAGFVALEMIHDTIREGTKEEMETYLNSESGGKSRRPTKEVRNAGADLGDLPCGRLGI